MLRRVPNLALPPQSDLLGLNYTDGDGYQYGLHPAMPEMQALFDDSKLAMIANVGTLIEPVTKAQILAGTAPLPLGLLSPLRSGAPLANLYATYPQRQRLGRAHGRYSVRAE